jgi:superfamily I DNA/RNA helicase
MKICRPETPQATADHLRPWFGYRFAAVIAGEPGSGKTTAVAHTIHAAIETVIPIHLIAAFSPTKPAANRLREMVGSFWPEVPPRDLFRDGMSGTATDALCEHSPLRFKERLRSHREVVNLFVDVIKQVGEIGDGKKSLKFLHARKREIKAAILADIEARLTGQELPLIAWFHEIADFYREYKRRNGMFDRADLSLAPIIPTTRCALLILDEVSAEDGALLRSIFPAASTITVGDDPGADLRIELTPAP